MTPSRTLIMHAGGGKAGSSAIQSALGRSVDALAKLGIAYAHAPAVASPYAITSGNGLFLYKKVVTPDWPSRGKTLLESYLGDQQIGICSSEFLGSMSESCWRRIIATAAEASIDVKVVYLVRSAVEYVIASYNQDVKRGGEHRTMEQAVRDAGWQHQDDLATLDSIFDRDHLKVINYDVAREDLIAAFTGAYPELLPAKKCLHSRGQITVNRSLSAPEIELMRQVNARFGDTFGQEISDRLIEANPELRPRPEVSEDVIDTLAGKFEDATSWINSRFFSDSSTALQFRPFRPPAASAGSERPEAALKVVLDWALEKIANNSGNQISFIREALLAIDWHNSNHPRIPRDFDPIAYLLINSDVLQTKNPPYFHYIESGHAEEREYRWPLRLDEFGDTTVSQAIARLRLDDSEGRMDSALWPRLRHALQLEALLHGFANREREYLDEIRRLHEEHGFDNERLRQRLRDTVRPIGEALETAQSETSQIIRDLGNAIGPLQSALEQAREEQVRTSSSKAAEIQESIVNLKTEWTSDITAIREEQARLNAALHQKDAQLAEQAEHLRQYRQYGFLKYLKWGLFRSARP
jgi:hypothetical protein